MAYCTLNLREKPPPGPTLHPMTHNVFKGTLTLDYRCGIR